MNNARPMSTWLGGSCWVPSAWRKSDITMTIRVKLVIMMRIAGASDRTVSRMTICIAPEKFSRLVRSGSRTGFANGAAVEPSGLAGSALEPSADGMMLAARESPADGRLARVRRRMKQQCRRGKQQPRTMFSTNERIHSHRKARL